MKKSIIILIVLVAVAAITASLCFATICCQGEINGSGRIVSRTVMLAPYSEIKASTGVKVVLVAGTPGEAVIEADDNVIDRVKVEVVDGNELVIRVENLLKPIHNMNVKVTVPTDGKLREVKASSAAQVSGEVVLTGAEVSLDASSAAKIMLDVHAERCEIDASSAADISSAMVVNNCHVDISSAAQVKLAGQAVRCDAEISSAGGLKAAELMVSHYDIEVSSAGNADIHCAKTLNAQASSGGLVRYSGEGVGHINTSSGGSVRKK